MRRVAAFFVALMLSCIAVNAILLLFFFINKLFGLRSYAMISIMGIGIGLALFSGILFFRKLYVYFIRQFQEL
jgi:hypothetical protein